MAAREGFPKERRLRRRSEFDRVFRRGRRFDGPLFVVIALPNGAAADRLGLTVGRKVGPAVARNRARRLLRESFRRLDRGSQDGYDVVVVVKRDILGRSLKEVDSELRERFRRVVRVRGLRGATASPRS